jgi:4-amino-4-deoxy-L-arabinose transferase-like glycosyltransferase
MDYVMAVVIGGALVVELIIALVAAPSDQLAVPPGAEHLLTHLRLLTGGGALDNLLPWSAGLGCLLVASRLTAQLGGGRRAQFAAAFLVATAPMVIAQATGVQTDLVTTAWVACVATLALDGLSRSTGPLDAVMLGLATGLTAVTGTAGLLVVGPLLLVWAVAQARLRWPRALAAAVLVLAAGAALAGPFTLRVDDPAMQRHDPAAILVNALRIGHTALDTPIDPLSRAATAAVTAAASLLGVPEDERTMTSPAAFPASSWSPSELSVSSPILAALALAATVVAVVRPGALSAPPSRTIRWYALACLAAGVAHAATLKWQPSGNRLLLPLLVVAAPLAGRWLAGALDNARRWPAPIATAFVVVAAVWATFTVSVGYPRWLDRGPVPTTQEQVGAAGTARLGAAPGGPQDEVVGVSPAT